MVLRQVGMCVCPKHAKPNLPQQGCCGRLGWHLNVDSESTYSIAMLSGGMGGKGGKGDETGSAAWAVSL